LKVLLIEDSEILTILLKHQAKILEVDLICVDNFGDAIIELKNNVFSFIILDNFLEKENIKGVDKAKILKSYSQAKIILSSADDCIISNDSICSIDKCIINNKNKICICIVSIVVIVMMV
jgi:DNA-binding response OmpR family regulator